LSLSKNNKTRLLLVEDNPGDARLITELLRSFKNGIVISYARNLHETLACLTSEKFDAVLLDLNLPDCTGLSTVQAVVRAAPLVPVIILTALDGEELGLQAIREGAQDYIPKAEMSHSLLMRTLRYAQRRMALQGSMRQLVDLNPSPMIVMSQTGVLRFANQAAQKILGQESLQEIMTSFYQMTASTELSREVSLHATDGQLRTFEMHNTVIEWEGELDAHLLNLHDVTECKRVQIYLEESNKALQTLVTVNADTLRLASKILEVMSEGVIVTDANKYITAVNPAFTSLSGYGVEELIGNKPEFMQSGLHGEKFYKTMWRRLITKGHWEGEIWNRHKDGSVFCVLESINVIHGVDGTISHYVSITHDITARVKLEQLIRKQALHDPLTGVANRMLLKETMAKAITLAQRNRYKVGVLFIDFDNFKLINDSYGHATGDWLLCEAAERMKRCARNSDLVARVGGDEFVIVLPELNVATDIEAALDRIVEALSKPYAFDGNALEVSFSIGVSMWPDHGSDSEELIDRADIAMYAVKGNGKGKWRMA
jgi:diguanylate cyclase (GGDEF)-like protein/PAS domain S-box-containing protein